MTKLSIALPLTALLLLGCTSTPQMPKDGGGLPPCGAFPNCVSSENEEASKLIDPIEASPAQWQALKSWLIGRADWEVVTDNGDFVQAVATTPTLRFRDDVQLRFDETSGIIHVRSSSRLGISDMGANRARVESLRAWVESQGS